MFYKIKKGNESGVKWQIDTMKINPIIIRVEREDDPTIKEKYEHSLYFPNCIWGYDVSDVQEVNNILDKLIDKHKIK
jgi:hypothetical protein